MIITDECMLYSFKNRSDKKASQIVDLREFPITKILSNNNNEYKLKKSRPKITKSLSSSSVFEKQKQKQKQNKLQLQKKKVLENKIIELSSNLNNNKSIHEFKTLMYEPWMNIFKKVQESINNNVPNSNCLLIQKIPSHVMSTIIASCLYSFERFILCRISKWFYSIFNLNEYNFIYHYYSDCLYWNKNLQQYISRDTSSSSLSSQHLYQEQIIGISSLYNRKIQRKSSSGTDVTNSVCFDFTNGNLSHLLNDKIKKQQLKYFIIAYDNIIQLQNITTDILGKKITFQQKLLLKESYSLVFEQRKLLPSYIFKQQQQKVNIFRKLHRSHSNFDISYNNYNSYLGDDISYLMIPSNINSINLSGNRKDFQKYGGMNFLCSLLLCNNLSPITINPLSIIRLDDNLLNVNDIKLFVEAILNRKTAMDNLTHLYLNSNPEIYSIQSMKLLFESIGKKCPNLKILSLRRINLINDEIFKIIVAFYKKYEKKTKLTNISLVGCSSISLEGIDWLNKNLFNLQNKNNQSLFSNIDILINIPKTQIIKHNHQNRWDKRIVVVGH